MADRKLSPAQWAMIRAEREASGTSFRELAEKYGVSHNLIGRKAKKEGWGDGTNLEPIIQRKTVEKVLGVDTSDSCDRKKLIQAVDAEAEKRAAVRLRHQREWEVIAGMRQEALLIRNTDAKKCFDKLKATKISAEITAIQQQGEIRAYGLDVPVDVTQMTDEQLEKLAKGQAPR